MATPETDTRTAETKDCPVCHGTGEVARTVRVGRKRRAVGEQSGICLNCLGTGAQPHPG
ncbi:hypothetical protein [Streptomyces griseorubiginosus]|uniref:hypothetical protein n=1 Tax=Streptomyces griseorubiginosus TaxID=67304 RepID=UPI001AD73041|nr:hypothetical protein [Streptomyces griseorubiginosus]